MVSHRTPGYHLYLPSAGNYLGLEPADLVGRYYPDVPLRAPVETSDSLVDTSKIQAELGWRPRGVDLFGPGPDSA